MINKASFYAKIIDDGLFKTLSADQVKCINILIDEWDKTGIDDLRQFAYLMATVFHETAFTMLPVTEHGSEAYLRSKPYFPWIGRGYIQLSWLANYKKFSKVLNIDLVSDPLKTLDPLISAKIAVIGMTKGLFTGVSLSKYFNSVKEDWVQARKIINSLDKAEVIAGYAKKFYEALT